MCGICLQLIYQRRVLNGLSTPQADTLRALLDGDLTGAEQSLTRVPDSLERLLLQFSVRSLEGAYGRKLRVQPQATAADVPSFSPSGSRWFVRVRRKQIRGRRPIQPFPRYCSIKPFRSAASIFAR